MIERDGYMPLFGRVAKIDEARGTAVISTGNGAHLHVPWEVLKQSEGLAVGVRVKVKLDKAGAVASVKLEAPAPVPGELPTSPQTPASVIHLELPRTGHIANGVKGDMARKARSWK